ncbi:MAG: magnesium and cobalt transport protein CorA, partial [Spirochaetaceae bacterium]|nr:magnesium and cobalt transport protein CorA [Spirochaetaceae bacterium]
MDCAIIGYNPLKAWMKTADTVASLEELVASRNTGELTWIHINALTDPKDLHPVAEAFKIHALTIEDILDREQRSKAEEFADYLFITLKTIIRHEEEIAFEQ